VESREWSIVYFRKVMKKIVSKHQDLEVYRKAFEAAMQIFEISTSFSKEETYSLTDQIRRSSRSVCANIAEAWRKRRYIAAFISKISDAEGEAAETQTWIEFAVRCGYLDTEKGRELFKEYDEVISMLVAMINNADSWTSSIREN
jgi:four helix bundle protein